MLLKSLATAALVAVASAVEVIPVRVGAAPNGTAGFFFSPDKIDAPVGSMVQFQFVGGNHTVTQSNFDNPCVPISTSNSSLSGIHSDYVAAMNLQPTDDIPVWTVQINSTDPMWLYCAQGRHCQNGMTMVINESPNNPDRTLENYRTAAASVEQAQTPSGNVGTGGQPGNADNQDGQDPQPAAAAGLGVPVALLAVAAGAALLI